MLEFLHVFRHVFLGHVNMSAANGALEMLPEVFKAVHMDIAANVFLCAMVYGVVIVALFGKAVVRLQFIGANHRAGSHIARDNRLQRACLNACNNLGHNLTVTLQHPEHDCLALGSASALAGVPSTNERFVNFDFAVKRPLAIDFRHVLTDMMRHAPRCLVCYAKLTLQFLRRNAVAGRGVEVDGVEPKLQWRARILKRGARCGVDVMPAPLAGIGAFGLDAIPVGFAFAPWARMALPMAHGEYVGQTGFIGWEHPEKVSNRDACFHGANLHEITTVCQGDNSVQKRQVVGL